MKISLIALSFNKINCWKSKKLYKEHQSTLKEMSCNYKETA